jgi:flagellar protein FliJ
MDSRAELLRLKDLHIGAHHRRRRVNFLQLKDFHTGQHRQQVTQLQAMIADFERLDAQLKLEIQTEEDRTRNHDPAHFAYSTLAKAAIVRRENLKQSISWLKTQIDAARKALTVAEPGAAGEAEQVDYSNHAA